MSTKRVKRSVVVSTLTTSFALVAAMTAILAGVITYIAWSFTFENYVRRNLQYSAEYIAQHAGAAYYSFDGWNFCSRAMIPQIAPRQDVVVQIFDSENRLIYDEGVFALPASNPYDRFELNTYGIEELSAGDENVVIAPIIVDFRQVGEVRVLPYESAGLLTPHDLEMRTTSLVALSVAGIIAIVASTLIGIAASRRLVKPILQVTEAAQRLRDGDEDARTGLTGSGEVSQLGLVFDRMADVIQHDRERERGMMSGVAHELRTPLMGIQATVEAIEDGIYPADSKHLSIILQETKRLTQLTDSLLELSRLENDKKELSLSVIDLSDPVNAVIAVNTARIEFAGLRLEVDLEPQLMVSADAARLQQAVTNLVTNSIRYTPEGGTITVRSYAEGKWARLSVTDTGIGISEEDLGHVFNRFWRADAARDRATGGTGIGLPIAKEIIERHNGSIEVESDKDVGATFTISLPRVE
ncbi:MAG: HAMP domain-containing histidine kinase [Coriobacteriia bacterium]|nr:HAMP domain-containing histidine kinase [Coriobacteriia bacterium]